MTVELKRYLKTIACAMVLACATFTASAYEEIVKTLTLNNAILWDSERYKHNALVEFLKYSPDTPDGNADAIRISFERKLNIRDTSRKPSGRMIYSQKWSVKLDTLLLHRVKAKCHVYVDGVYKRDSITVKTKYRAKGPMTLRSFDYTDENKQPLDRNEEVVDKGNSYIPVTEQFFNWLKDFKVWPVVETEERELMPLRISLVGPDSTYVVPIDKKKKITATVGKDNMVVTLSEKGIATRKVTFTKKKEALTLYESKDDKGKYTKMFVWSDTKNSPYIEVRSGEIIFHDGKTATSVAADSRQLSRAIRLAIKRGIFTDPDDFSDDWFYYDFW